MTVTHLAARWKKRARIVPTLCGARTHVKNGTLSLVTCARCHHVLSYHLEQHEPELPIPPEVILEKVPGDDGATFKRVQQQPRHYRYSGDGRWKAKSFKGWRCRAICDRYAQFADTVVLSRDVPHTSCTKCEVLRDQWEEQTGYAKSATVRRVRAMKRRG